MTVMTAAAKREKIELRVTHEEKELVRAAAEKEGLSTSAWILRSAMMDDTDILDALARQRAEEAREATLSAAERLFRDDLRLLREPLERLEKGLHDGTLRDELRTILRELRGELAGIRTRLDGLAAIERQLSYQGQRMAAIEKRFATLLETRLDGSKKVTPPAKPA